MKWHSRCLLNWGGALLRAKTMPVKMAPRVEVVRDKAEAIQEVAEETVDQEVPLVLEGAAEEKPDQDIIEQSEECYKGFLYVQCPECGTMRGFCSKHEISSAICNDCGASFSLQALVPLYAKCECGARYRYMTNLAKSNFDIDCITCGSPMSVSWNKKKKQFDPMEG